MLSNNKARIQIILSMVIFGTIGAFVKNIPLPSAEIALWRAVTAFLMLTGAAAAGGRLKQIRAVKGRILILLGSGAALAFNWILLFEAYRYTSVAVSTLCYYFAPTLIVLSSVLIFREKLKVRQAVCFAASTAGLVLVIGVSGGGSNDTAGALYGLGAAVCYAGVVFFNKTLGDIDGLVRTWLQFGAAMLIMFPYVIFTCGFAVTGLDAKGTVLLLIVGVVHTGITYCMYFASLTGLKGQQAAILSYLDPMVAILVSFIVLGETVTVPQIAGGAMIIGFAFLNEVKGRSRRKAKEKIESRK